MKKEKKKRFKIYSTEFTGYLDEMPEELKLAREARKNKNK